MHWDIIAYATSKQQITKLQIAWRFGEVISVRHTSIRENVSTSQIFSAKTTSKAEMKTQRYQDDS